MCFRLQEIEDVLANKIIDMRKLRELCSQGCPNEGSSRSLIWKLLLNYLPKDRSQWTQVLTKRRNEYQEFIRDMIIRPGFESKNKSEEMDHVM